MNDPQMLWTADQIAGATQGMASADFAVTGIAFDTRETGHGDLFVAMPGTAHDGHDFLDAAIARGASAVLVSRSVGHPHVLVADTATALGALAIAGRARTTARVVGITGSVGKTGTKEALAAALGRKPGTQVHRSVKSYNNHTGVPLSLARMPMAADYAVLEMGMNHAGEIAALTRLVRPHVALITAIAPAHIQFFDSIEGIADAKGEIFQGLEPGGIAIVPYDTPQRDRLIAHARPYAADILTFGSGEGADVRAHHAIETTTGTSVMVALPGVELSLTVGQPGAHWVSNALAVLAVVHALGADLGIAALALADLEPMGGRGSRLSVRIGDGTALVIDESYNANPTSMMATLAVLAREPSRRVAVLGAMGELGEAGDALHAGLAESVIEAGVAVALLVGDGIEPLAEALADRIEVMHVADAVAAQSALARLARAGDAILVKGSNSIGLSTVVAALKSGSL